MLGEGLLDDREEEARDVVVDEEGLGGVADGDVLALGVDGDADGHVEVGVGVDVDVADAVGVAEDGDGRVGHDVADEFVGAAGDDQVDLVVEGEHVGDVLAGFEQVQEARGQAGGGACAGDGVGEDAVGVGRFGAALEEAGVAGFEAEGGDLDEGVGAGLEDDADDADGAGDAVELEVGVHFDGGEGAADGVGELDEAVDAGTDVVELGLVEFEAFEQRGGEVALPGGGQIAFVGGDDLGGPVLQSLGNLGQGGVLDFGLDGPQPDRSRLRRRRTLGCFHFS